MSVGIESPAARHAARVELVRFPDRAAAEQALRAGKVDALLLDPGPPRAEMQEDL